MKLLQRLLAIAVLLASSIAHAAINVTTIGLLPDGGTLFCPQAGNALPTGSGARNGSYLSIGGNSTTR